MPTAYKPGQLNPVFLPGWDTSPSATGAGFAPGGIDQPQAETEITVWARDLAERVRAGDPAAIAEMEQLARGDQKKINDPRGNMARKVSNTLLGTKYLTPYEKSSVLGDLAPGLAIMGGIAGLGLLAPAVAGGGAAGAAGSFGSAGMAGATGAGGLGAAGAGLGVGAGAAGSAGGGGLGGLGAGAAGSAGAASGGLPAALGSGLSAGGVLKGIGKTLPLVAGGLGAIGAGKLGGQAEDLRNQAARIAMEDYRGRQPFREAALSGLMGAQPQREDLSGLFSDPSNPYRRPVPRPGAS